MSTQPIKKTSSYREPLILIAFVILGAILGLILGDKAAFLSPIGQIWLNMLFVLLVPLIFFSISSAISTTADTRRVGKLLGLTISIFVIYFFIRALRCVLCVGTRASGLIVGSRLLP